MSWKMMMLKVMWGDVGCKSEGWMFNDEIVLMTGNPEDYLGDGQSEDGGVISRCFDFVRLIRERGYSKLVKVGEDSEV